LCGSCGSLSRPFPLIDHRLTAAQREHPEVAYALSKLENVQASYLEEPGTGALLYVVEAGPLNSDRPPLVLVHGLGHNAGRDFHAVFGALSRERRVIAIDLPGFGRSERVGQNYGPERFVAVIDELLRARQTGQVDLLGHSLGGAVALLFAAKHPDKLRHLVLIDVAGILHREVFVREQARHRLSGLRDKAPFGGGAIDSVGGWLLSMVAKIDPSAQTVSDAGAFGGTVGSIAATSLIAYDFGPSLGHVRAPTLLLWGENDPIASPRTGTLLDDRLADSRLVVFKDAGHVPMADHPAEVSAHILEHLDGTAQGPAPLLSASVLPEAHCRNQDDFMLTGHYRRVTIDECKRVWLHNLHASTISIRDSDARLDHVYVSSGLVVEDARIIMSGGELSGDIALDSTDSKTDLAGVALKAKTAAVRAREAGEHLFSVCPTTSPKTRGWLHGMVKLKAGETL